MILRPGRKNPRQFFKIESLLPQGGQGPKHPASGEEKSRTPGAPRSCQFGAGATTGRTTSVRVGGSSRFLTH